MWPFSAKSSEKSLEERLEHLERTIKALQFEWDDTYDKLRRVMGRVVKSSARLSELETAPTPAVASGDNGTGQESRGRLLTPRQMQLQQQILQRRGSAR